MKLPVRTRVLESVLKGSDGIHIGDAQAINEQAPKNIDVDIYNIKDDCLGSIKRESKINHLCSRYRHFNIKLLVISSQKFKGSVSPIIRANATDVIIGSPFPNQKELQAVAEEYGDLFGGADNWLKMYRQATPNKYDFCYMDLQSNPPFMYHNFESVVGTGGYKDPNAENTNTEVFEKK